MHMIKEERVLFNTNIELRLLYLPKFEQLPFSEKDLELLEIYGKAVGFAREHLQGLRHVTRDGYIRCGYRGRIPPGTMGIRPAFLSIDEFVVGLFNFDRILKGEIEWSKNTPIVQMYYDNGENQHIRVDRKGVYIPNVRAPEETILFGRTASRRKAVKKQAKKVQ